jgi:NAD(P)H-dependent FMN reductase
MSTIIGLCGSLRHGSFNHMLLRAAVGMAPPGTSIEPESIREIPMYDGDVEDDRGLPPAVRRLKDRIADLIDRRRSFLAAPAGDEVQPVDW